MSKLESLRQLNELLLKDMPEYKAQAKSFPLHEDAQFRLFRSLVNVRRPKAIPKSFLSLQDAFLKQVIAERGVTHWQDLQPRADGIYLWQGDITTLAVDAIVNAANSGLTGCYIPCHACIDNCIHTFAGVQLRLDCSGIMEQQGYEEPTGQAKITPAYNLPSRYVIHTVGPIVDGSLTDDHRELLANCYRSCLKLADENSLESIAFCCISTGVFHFPSEEAAKIALREVKEYQKNSGHCHVIFNVFGDKDWAIYDRLLTKRKT